MPMIHAHRDMHTQGPQKLNLTLPPVAPPLQRHLAIPSAFDNSKICEQNTKPNHNNDGDDDDDYDGRSLIRAVAHNQFLP